MGTILRTATTSLAADFAWHQSGVGTMLRCPRRFKLRYVDRVPLDHQASNYANILGTADHKGIEFILKCIGMDTCALKGGILDAQMAGFQEAVLRAEEHGEHVDPDGLDRALERLEGERLERLLVFAADPRIHAVDWKGIEWKFEFSEEEGRRWKGTLDAWGVAKLDIPAFGSEGRDSVGLLRGEPIVVDWKTGECPPFGWVERSQSVQLGIYAMALNRERPAPWRTFLGIIQDLDRPKAPSDADGKRIPKNLPKAINPTFVRAVFGEVANQMLQDGSESIGVAHGSKKRPRDADGKPIPKWLPEAPNPAFTEATSRPKGPLFREARVSFPHVLDTVRAAVTQAELGLFPASGAATGQCLFCPYKSVCATSYQEETDAQS